jgi:hypothetical protein
VVENGFVVCSRLRMPKFPIEHYGTNGSRIADVDKDDRRHVSKSAGGGKELGDDYSCIYWL